MKSKFCESRTRSIYKSISWRIVAFLNSWFILSTQISDINIINALLMNITGMTIFYGFERIWNKIKYGKRVYQ